ncbi:cobyric acid synthase [Paenibacillus polygoni]|uniref:Cobyric acid synthase n=2 Tax=Paenibacillus polygoni TaxID=3050112 RepID=A0ABY8X779_9BACL|nr:cobyric acid synthase [Paenibacillus polygoni]WIV21407.1 cobyric acid synthase [Paenibacillus polygoni]
MLQGTASDVGKSIVTTALCRLFLQDGYQPAPYKSQNMALNSYVTLDGKEIGRAQGVQAEACGLPATTDMNPILIKPIKDMHSQIVVHGVPKMQMSAMDYRNHFLPQAKTIVLDALDRLREQYDIVLMEGAGSPAEINLKDRDIVNMNLAGWADAPVLLISDIDRGGVFASLVGTLELLEPHERARVKGFIINKFRGDLALLQPGLDWLTERTGIPVLGVLPYIPELRIEAEDSVVLDELQYRRQKEKEIDIVVIRYPRISNFTDFDALGWEPDVVVRYVSTADELGEPDVIILPGTKDTISDLNFLRERGLDRAIQEQWQEREVQLVGICGGYQMLGERLFDPFAVESEIKEAEGLGLLPLVTTFAKEKRTVRVKGTAAKECPLRVVENKETELTIEAYEIHMGITESDESAGLRSEDYRPLFVLNTDTVETKETEDIREAREAKEAKEAKEAGSSAEEVNTRHFEGCGAADGKVWGTYLHGLFDNDEFRRAWLDGLRLEKGLSPIGETFQAAVYKTQEFDRVAEIVRNHLDLDQIYEIIGLRNKQMT